MQEVRNLVKVYSMSGDNLDRALELCVRIEEELEYLETLGLYYTVTEFNQELYDLSTRIRVLRTCTETFEDYLRRNSSRYSDSQRETKEEELALSRRVLEGAIQDLINHPCIIPYTRRTR